MSQGDITCSPQRMSELQSVLVRLCSATLKLAAQPRVDQELIDRIITLSDEPECSQVNNKRQDVNCQSQLSPALQESQSFIVHLCSAALKATIRPQVDQGLINEILSLTDSPGYNSHIQDLQSTSSGSQSLEAILRSANTTTTTTITTVAGQEINNSSGSRVFTHESTIEFPNGDVGYSRKMDKSNTGVGWAMLVYGHNNSVSRQIYNKSCLDVYQCPLCSYVENPRIPRAGKISKHARPMPAKDVCKIDGSKLVHIPCLATLKVMLESGMVYFTHRGIHNHAKPRVTQAKSRTSQTLRPNQKNSAQRAIHK